MTEDAGSDLDRSLDRSGNRSFWINVAASVLASAIFLILFQPLIVSLSEMTGSIVGDLALIIVDSMYRQASLGANPLMLFFLYTLSCVLAASVITLPLAISFSYKKRFDIEKFSKRPSTYKIFLSVQLIISITMMCSLSYLLSVALVGVQANASFQQYSAVAAPNMSLRQHQMLHARWALVDSRSDYNALMRDIEEQARAGGWSLPKRLL